MPKQMTPEERREYQRTYRARKKEGPQVEMPVLKIESDRDRGLPRSNYYSDWSEDIRRADQRVLGRILEHPAIKTTRSSKG